MKKIRWGILSTARIGTRKVIPAMQRGAYCEVSAIASRDLQKARDEAARLSIPKAYGSYDELIADSEIDAIYNPLPNHLHVPWSLKAIAAGKHVLCEKPIALSTVEAESLVEAARRRPELKVMEAFMYRHHPQWHRANELVATGAIGDLRVVHSFFSYYNDDPRDVRNIAEIGGGGLMDIGCYCISFARLLFGSEPSRVCGIVGYDPKFKTDRLASALLDFDRGTASFTCSTQLAYYQRAHIFGTTGRVEIEIPVNAPPDRPSRIWHQQDSTINEIVLDACDQYTLQGDLFSQAILNDTPVPTPLEDAVANMRVIEAIVESARRNSWVEMVTLNRAQEPRSNGS